MIFLGVVLFCMQLICTYGSTANLIGINSYLTEKDVVRFSQLLDATVSRDTTPMNLMYSILSYQLINKPIPQNWNVCKKLELYLKDDTANLENYYYVASIWKYGKCPGNLPATFTKVFTDTINKESSSAPDLFHSVSGLKTIGQPLTNPAKLIKSLQTILKKDDSILNLGYVFHIASQLTNKDGAFAFDRIEDAVVQADEIDGRLLQFEGGLSVTASVLNGAYNLAGIQNKVPPISINQAIKFVNYLLSRSSVQTPKGIYALLSSLNTFSTNKWHVAVSVSTIGTVSRSSPKLQIKCVNVFGQVLPTLPNSLILESLTRVTDSVITASKLKMEQSKTDKTIYFVQIMDGGSNILPGEYKAVLSVPNGTDGKFVGITGTTISLRILATGILHDLQIGAADADQVTPPRFQKVTGKHEQVLELDLHQRFSLKFSIRDEETKKALTVHQAFVRFVSVDNKRELTFVAEKDNTVQYKLDLVVASKLATLPPGLYQVYLVVGDFILSNSFSKNIIDVQLTGTGGITDKQKSTDKFTLKPKPEIKHLFKEPEKRPPVFVSNLFTAFVLLPLLILFIMWFKLGVNISNFPLSLSAIGFHLSLGGIFTLFSCFWLRLTMFSTLKYLLGFGVATFLCGNKMLANLANKIKK